MQGTGIDMKDVLDKLTVDIKAFKQLAEQKKGVILDKDTKIAKGYAKEVLVTTKKLRRVVVINQASMVLISLFNIIVVLSIVVIMNNLVSTRPLGSTWALPAMVVAVMLANVFAGRVVKEWVLSRAQSLEQSLRAKKKILDAATASKKTSV